MNGHPFDLILPRYCLQQESMNYYLIVQVVHSKFVLLRKEPPYKLPTKKRFSSYNMDSMSTVQPSNLAQRKKPHSGDEAIPFHCSSISSSAICVCRSENRSNPKRSKSSSFDNRGVLGKKDQVYAFVSAPSALTITAVFRCFRS